MRNKMGLLMAGLICSISILAGCSSGGKTAEPAKEAQEAQGQENREAQAEPSGEVMEFKVASVVSQMCIRDRH